MSSLDRAALPAAAHPVSGMRVADRARAGLLLAGIAACYVAVIAVRPLVAPDEFRYAEVPREMIASGDWIVPRLDGVLYFEKPPLGYWLTALSIRAFGENSFAVRLPFALTTLLTGAIVYALARRFGSRSAAAPVAAIGFLTSAEVAIVGTAAVLDALFSLCVTAALAALFVASEQRPGAARQSWLAMSGAACGAAFLTKGFLAFAIPIAVAVPYLVWSRRTRDLLRLPWTPLFVALAIAAPWSIAIARAQPDFWHQFIFNEHLRRFAGSDAQHAAPFWYFVPVVVVGALPWISLLVDVVRHRAAIVGSPLSRFCMCWFVAPLVIFSASSGKLATYALPCFPPLFILLVEAVVALPRPRLARHLGWIAGIAAVLGAVAAVVLLVLPFGLTAFYSEDAGAIRVLGVGVALLAVSIAALALRRADAMQRATAIAAAASLGYVVAALAFPTGNVPKMPERWLEQREGAIPPDAIVAADRNFLHAVSWELRRADVIVLGGRGELGYGLAQPDQHGRTIQVHQLAELIRDPARTRSVVVIGSARRTLLPVGLTPDRTETSGGAVMGVYDPPNRIHVSPSPSASARSDT
jgi:4-amino-4-deoxy-L-arabinose transferase